jgi:hypothetical protein
LGFRQQMEKMPSTTSFPLGVVSPSSSFAWQQTCDLATFSELCDEPVDQKFREIPSSALAVAASPSVSSGWSVKGPITTSRASASAQSSSEADCHWEVTLTKSKQNFVHESSTMEFSRNRPPALRFLRTFATALVSRWSRQAACRSSA